VTYQYTDVNQLVQPHSYMYTPYQGKAFITAYLKDRKEDMQRFKLLELKEQLSESDRYICEISKNFLSGGLQLLDSKSIKQVSDFDDQLKIFSEELLISLIFSQFSKEPDVRLKHWVDFLVQRFEVTKKIHEIYHPNKHRKGGGGSENTRLYWLFSLLLTLNYRTTNNVKHLSTNLKINDLLCSLNDDFCQTVPKQGLLLVLSAEIEHINVLFRGIKGVTF
jgi:hypothetical protein